MASQQPTSGALASTEENSRDIEEQLSAIRIPEMADDLQLPAEHEGAEEPLDDGNAEYLEMEIVEAPAMIGNDDAGQQAIPYDDAGQLEVVAAPGPIRWRNNWRNRQRNTINWIFMMANCDNRPPRHQNQENQGLAQPRGGGQNLAQPRGRGQGPAQPRGRGQFRGRGQPRGRGQ